MTSPSDPTRSSMRESPTEAVTPRQSSVQGSPTEAVTPRRWLDDGHGLPEELVLGLRSYAAVGPDPALQSEMCDAIERTVSSTASPEGKPGAAAPALSKLKLGVVLALVAGAVFVGTRAASPPERARVPEVARVVQESKPPRASSSQAPRDDGASEPVSAPVVKALPAPQPRAQRAGSSKAKHKAQAAQPVEAPSVATSSDPVSELTLLSQARRVLAGSPERSLALVDEHVQHYARGMFVQEREVIAVEALLKLGRSQEARERAARFERDYPASPHLERLRVALSAP